MYTVKKFKAGEVIHKINLSKGKWLEWRAKRAVEWVIMKDGEALLSSFPNSTKLFPEVYYQKSTAQQQADWYNEQGEK